MKTGINETEETMRIDVGELGLNQDETYAFLRMFTVLEHLKPTGEDANTLAEMLKWAKNPAKDKESLDALNARICESDLGKKLAALSDEDHNIFSDFKKIMPKIISRLLEIELTKALSKQ